MKEVVKLETAQKLSRFGYPQGVSKMRYSRTPHTSSYTLIGDGYAFCHFDAPNFIELVEWNNKHLHQNICLLGIEGLANIIIEELKTIRRLENRKKLNI